jgi:hypothetical protein
MRSAKGGFGTLLTRARGTAFTIGAQISSGSAGHTTFTRTLREICKSVGVAAAVLVTRQRSSELAPAAELDEPGAQPGRNTHILNIAL